MKNWNPQLVQVGYNAGKVRNSNLRNSASRYRIILRNLHHLTKCGFNTWTAACLRQNQIEDKSVQAYKRSKGQKTITDCSNATGNHWIKTCFNWKINPCLCKYISNSISTGITAKNMSGWTHKLFKFVV